MPAASAKKTASREPIPWFLQGDQSTLFFFNAPLSIFTVALGLY